MNNHKVSFITHTSDNIYIIPIVRRRMSQVYYRGLVQRCSIAQKELFDYLACLTHGGIFPLTEDPEEDPLKVNNPNVSWDEDESPMELLDIYKKANHSRKELFDVLYKYCFQQKEGTHVLVPYRNYILHVNCSGTGFKQVVTAKSVNISYPITSVTSSFTMIHKIHVGEANILLKQHVGEANILLKQSVKSTNLSPLSSIKTELHETEKQNRYEDDITDLMKSINSAQCLSNTLMFGMENLHF